VAFAWEFRVFHGFYWLQEIIKSWLLSSLRLRKFHIKVSEISSKVSKVAAVWSSRAPRWRRRYKSDSLRDRRCECSNPSGRREFLSFIPALGFIQSPLQWEPWPSHGSAAALVWRLTTQTALVPRLRMRTAILPLPFYDLGASYRVSFSLFPYSDLSQAYWRIILRWIIRKWDVGVWTGSSWLRIGTGGGHLWMRLRNFGCHKVRKISWLAAEPVSFLRTLLHGVSEWMSE